MSDDFLNRTREIAALHDIHRRKGAQLMAIYGRRRIGKTSLLMHWIEREVKAPSVYWVAWRSTPAVLLAAFSQALQPLLRTDDPGFTFSSWEAALQALARLAEKRPLVVVLDELPYLLESVPSFATILQAAWDRILKRSQLRLIIAGSHYHMMQDTFASPKGALFGRTTADLHVGEVALSDMSLFLPGYSPEQLVETWSVIGGIPKYLEMWNDRHPVLRNVQDVILSPSSIFRNEPSFLIHDEIADPRTYLGILHAIGGGAKRPVEVAQGAGVQLAHVGKYLATLESLRFVRRVVSVDAESPRASRKTRYEVRDPYLKFHFAFVQPNLQLVEQGRIDRLMELIRAGFDAWTGRVGYEEVCRRHVAQLADRRELPLDVLDVGRLWDGRVEIDVAAIDRRSRSALLGECRFRGRPMPVEALDGLRAKAEGIRALAGYKLRYALFSRSGFTAALAQRAKREAVLLVEGVPSGEGAGHSHVR